MRNATEADVVEFKITGVLKEDVMYCWVPTLADETLVHGKKLFSNTKLVLDSQGRTLGEQPDGTVVLIDKRHISAIPRGVSKTPPKPKRTPKKGTNPFTPYNPETIKVGDKVRLRNGKIHTVTFVEENSFRGLLSLDLGAWGNDIYNPDNRVFKDTGAFNSRGKHFNDIVGMAASEPEVGSSIDGEMYLGMGSFQLVTQAAGLQIFEGKLYARDVKVIG